jgi:hypothetical protein
MTEVQPSALVNSVMGKIYDTIANGDETVPKSEDNFFSWCSPGVPTDPADFEFLQQGLTGVVKREAIAQITTPELVPAGGDAPAPAVELTPALLDQLRAEDSSRLYVQAESLARLVDLVVDVTRGDNNQAAKLAILNNEGSLSDVYQYVLRMSQVMQTELDEATKAKIEKFRGLLTVMVTKKNLIDDSETVVSEPSPLTKAYFEKMAAYEAAALEYNARRVDALAASTPAAIHFWAMNANILRRNVQAAMMDWVNNGKNDFESISAFIDQVMRRDMALLKQQYNDELQNARLTGLASGSDFFYTTLVPASFATATGWARFNFSSGDVQRYASSSYSTSKWQTKGGAGWLGILGGAGTATATGGHSRRAYTSKFNVDTFDLSFEIGQAIISRPWFKPAFLNSRSWRFDQNNPETRGEMLSDAGAPPKGLMPAYPTAVIFIRNLHLKFGHSEGFRSFMEENASTSAGGGGYVNFGALHLGGAYSRASASGSTQAINGYSWDGEGLHVPGLQIVGFKCHVLPKSPDPLPEIRNWI